ncbi:MAG: YIP1 family protein [Terriglobia bacterium]
MATEMTQPASPGAPRTEPGPARRFAGVFFDPVSTFASIVREPDFWTPLIALMAIAAAAAELILARVGMERIIRSSLEASGRAKGLSPEQIQKAVGAGARVGTVFAHLSFITVPIFLIIVAAVGMLILKAGFGLEIRFREAFSVTTYASLPNFLAGILGLVVIGLGDPAQFNPKNFIPASVGFFLSPQSVSPALYALATSLNLFTFWCMALLGIGFAATVGRKVRPRTIFFCFLGLWVVWTLLKTGAAAI